MAALSSISQDRLLFGLSLAVTCAVVVSMRQLLSHYRDTATVPPSENKPQYITQEVEDSLNLGTLERLLHSPSWAIRDTTQTIICERAIYDEATFDVILYHITRPDHDMREKGIRALNINVNLNINNSTIRALHKPAAYAALVRCLEYCVGDYEHKPFDPEWDNWNYRDCVERLTLTLLSQLLEKYGPEGLLRSRFIERWLGKEPWGNEEFTRMSNFAEAIQAHGQKLNDIISSLFRHPRGRRQLNMVRLVPESVADLNDTQITNGDSPARDDCDHVFVDSRRRRGDQSLAGEHMRRRHREAMVLNDGSRPLERGDIIQRER